MFQLSNNKWSFGDLGIFNLPENVLREDSQHEWRVTSSASKQIFRQFKDNEVGYSPTESLSNAVTYSLGFGSLLPEVQDVYRNLYNKDRLQSTGIPFMYFKRGLNPHYLVVWKGSFYKEPFNEGKGFNKAAARIKHLIKSDVDMSYFESNIGFNANVVI